jgi:hypothetical protein
LAVADWKIGKIIGVSRSTIWNYRTNHLKMAKRRRELPTGEILAELRLGKQQKERSRKGQVQQQLAKSREENKARAVWEQSARLVGLSQEDAKFHPMRPAGSTAAAQTLQVNAGS